VRAYRDLTEDKNLDLGASFAWGPTDLVEPPIEGGDSVTEPPPPVELGRRLIGVDATFRFRPLERAIYRRLNLRTELIWSRQDLPAGDPASAFGFYVMGEYQFARRWYLGARADRSGRAFDGEAVDRGGAVFLTFWATEFSLVRSQFRHTRYAEGISGNEVLLQFNFSIGAHGAHVF
jgi:hypothetical protein